MHFGTPTQRMKDCFTYVLKVHVIYHDSLAIFSHGFLQGHIALAMAVFPEGVLQ